MTKIIFVNPEGEERVIDATDGVSVMENAMQNGVDGILADCGGACACATCHVYVDDAFAGKLNAPTEMEISMLEMNDYRRDNSRLSCQITVSAELEGLKVHTPESQY